MPKLPGLLKGMGVTFKTMLKPAVTVQYPHEKETPVPRARGVIALFEENCTSCMLCARECPDWCIYIEAHKYLAPPRREGGKPRQKNKLDRFDIDYALCMYCGICVEVCPFDALFWSPEYEYSESRIADLLHDKTRLGEWMETVPEFEPYESGSEQKSKKVPKQMAAENFFFWIIAALMVVSAVRVVTTRNIVHAALWLILVLAGAAAQFVLLLAEFTAVTQVLVYIGAIVVLFLFGIMLTKAPLGNSLEHDPRQMVAGAVVAVALAGLLGYVLWDTWGDDKIEFGGTAQAAEVVPHGAEVSPAIAAAKSDALATANTEVVSDSIFRDYLIPFEAVSVLLLGALMGAIVLARRD